MPASTPRPRVTPVPCDPHDPLGLAADAPLLAAWLDWMQRAAAGTLMPMSTPGHKQRQDLTGAVVAGDAPLYGGLDSIKHADHLLADAQARAAALWGADWCRFSVAGSTHGNQAFCLALGQPEQQRPVQGAGDDHLLAGLAEGQAERLVAVGRSGHREAAPVGAPERGRAGLRVGQQRGVGREPERVARIT